MTKRDKIQYCAMALAALMILALDQITKSLVIRYIPLYSEVALIPGFIGLTYVRNTGAAFSSLEGMRWLFVGIFAVLTLGILWEFPRKRLPLTTLERWCVACIYGGGLGNLVDRVRLGYVVDMIQTKFINFPVFNVADCFITCGCILLVAHLILFNRDFWKEEKK